MKARIRKSSPVKKVSEEKDLEELRSDFRAILQEILPFDKNRPPIYEKNGSNKFEKRVEERRKSKKGLKEGKRHQTQLNPNFSYYTEGNQSNFYCDTGHQENLKLEHVYTQTIGNEETPGGDYNTPILDIQKPGASIDETELFSKIKTGVEVLEKENHRMLLMFEELIQKNNKINKRIEDLLVEPEEEYTLYDEEKYVQKKLRLENPRRDERDYDYKGCWGESF